MVIYQSGPDSRTISDFILTSLYCSYSDIVFTYTITSTLSIDYNSIIYDSTSNLIAWTSSILPGNITLAVTGSITNSAKTFSDTVS